MQPGRHAFGVESMSAMTTGRKLTLAGLVVAGVTGYMAFVGGSASWQYYVTPQECLQRAASWPVIGFE